MKNELQEKILQTAYNLFLEKGYNETTTREIAEKAGIERGHLYYYYSKKEDMLFAWYNRFLNEIYSKIMELCSDEKDGFVLIILCDLVYYKAIFEDKRIINLLATILENRTLTKAKIDHTYPIYQEILDERQVDYNPRELYIGTCVLIGAEVELFLNMLEQRIDMEYSEFVDRIIDIHLDTFNLATDSKSIIKRKTEQYLTLFKDEILMQLIRKTSTVLM